MDFLYKFKATFEDPLIVSNIQKCFGVSYNEVAPSKSFTSEEHQCQDKVSVRKKSGQHAVDFHEATEDNELINKTCEDGIKRISKSSDKRERRNYLVHNKFWYCLFYFGTYLGDEVGYAIFLPFWFWNIDGAVARKLVLVWTVVMYVGQSIKDVVRWPRPSCPPVVRLQNKWSMEHGMPSTHAMVGVAFPSSLLYYSLPRYEFSVLYGIILSILWCILISLSRLYLGMHSLLDVIVGLLLSSFLVLPLLPIMNYVDEICVHADWYPAALLIITMFLLCFYPSRSWTPTKGDTSIILGTCFGIQGGWWLNFKLEIDKFSGSFSHVIEMPTWSIVGYAVLRTLIGLFGIVISFIGFDVFFKVTDKLLEKININVRDGIEKRRVSILDLCYKYVSYSVTSFHVVCSIPFLFKLLNIGRDTYYYE